MKKPTKIFLATAIIFNFQFSIFNPLALAQNRPGNTILHRTNIELTYNYLGSVNFKYGGGFLKHHPERAIDLNASMRIMQHLEVGAVLSLRGTSATGFSGTYPLSTAPNVDFFYLGWDDSRYHLSAGVMVQLHLNPFDKRYRRENRADLLLRGGWGLGGQVDGFWFGFGEEFRVTRQLLWTISADYGAFPIATLQQLADNEIGWRFCTGLKISLK